MVGVLTLMLEHSEVFGRRKRMKKIMMRILSVYIVVVRLVRNQTNTGRYTSQDKEEIKGIYEEV
jgi:hypothetical protein